MPVFLSDAAPLHERQPMSIRRFLGLAAPGAGLKPYRGDVFDRGFLDMRRHGIGPAKDDDKVNGTRHIGQTRARSQAADIGAIRTNGNHVVTG
jgi:hypothetical protein